MAQIKKRKNKNISDKEGKGGGEIKSKIKLKCIRAKTFVVYKQLVLGRLEKRNKTQKQQFQDSCLLGVEKM